MLIFSAGVYSQNNTAQTDFLNVPGPILFEKKLYNLNWSSHPAIAFYKQEYIVKGDLTDKYKTMILIDVIVGQENIKEVVAAKLAELKKLKAGNPFVTYEAVNSGAPGEYMIDFVLTANSPNGKASILLKRIPLQDHYI